MSLITTEKNRQNQLNQLKLTRRLLDDKAFNPGDIVEISDLAVLNNRKQYEIQPASNLNGYVYAPYIPLVVSQMIAFEKQYRKAIYIEPFLSKWSKGEDLSLVLLLDDGEIYVVKKSELKEYVEQQICSWPNSCNCS